MILMMLVLIAVGAGIVCLCCNIYINKCEDIQDTPYQFYASLGGYELPPEGFSMDQVPRSEMSSHVHEQVERLNFFLDL